jgi:hypothetical protein
VSAPAFTPGPWKADANLGCKRISAKPFRGQQHKQAKRFEVACTPGIFPEEEDEANARLIAAAPELYEALRELLVAVRYADPPKDFGAPHESNFCHEARIPVDFVTIAERALAKARGEQ